jgi:hypothetical protein
MSAIFILVQEYLLQSEAVLHTAGLSNIQLLFNGLRVRMGMASGLSDAADLAFNKQAGRYTYLGQLLAAAKGSCDAAQGGMVLLHQTTFKRVRAGSVPDVQALSSTSECAIDLTAQGFVFRVLSYVFLCFFLSCVF